MARQVDAHHQAQAPRPGGARPRRHPVQAALGVHPPREGVGSVAHGREALDHLGAQVAPAVEVPVPRPHPEEVEVAALGVVEWIAAVERGGERILRLVDARAAHRARDGGGAVHPELHVHRHVEVEVLGGLVHPAASHAGGDLGQRLAETLLQVRVLARQRLAPELEQLPDERVGDVEGKEFAPDARHPGVLDHLDRVAQVGLVVLEGPPADDLLEAREGRLELGVEGGIEGIVCDHVG